MNIFNWGGLYSKDTLPLNKEDYLLGGYKSIKELRETEPELFFKNGEDAEYLRISPTIELNGVRMCIAAPMWLSMKRDPRPSSQFWLDLVFVYFDKNEYKRNKTVKTVRIEDHIMLYPKEAGRQGHFLSADYGDVFRTNPFKAIVSKDRNMIRKFCKIFKIEDIKEFYNRIPQ